MSNCMILADGWLEQCERKLTVNYDERPDGVSISAIVLHCISLPPGCFGGDYIEALFANRLDPRDHPYFLQIAELRVSSHLLITREGVINQFVPFNKRAWHAGLSCFQDRNRCNDFSVGIELEGTESIPYTAMQYASLSEVLCALMHHYPEITVDRIVAHSAIAPGRKTDPGPSLDWARVYRTL